MLQHLAGLAPNAIWIVPESSAELVRARIPDAVVQSFSAAPDMRFQTPELLASHRAYTELKKLSGEILIHAPLAEGISYFAVQAGRREWTSKSHGGPTQFAEPWIDRARATLLHTEDVVAAAAANRETCHAASGATDKRVTVSAVVPVFNLHQYLDQTLTSLRAQTRELLEILVVDDGSTDAGTIAELRKLETDRGSSGPELRVIRKPHSGLSATRNVGISHARGTHILTLDADDLIRPTFVAEMVALYERSPDLLLATSLVSCFVESPAEATGGWCPLGFERRMLPVFNFASCATALMPRDAVLAAGGYDHTLPAYEDWDLYCRLAQRGKSAVVPEFLIDVRIRPDSMLRSMSRTMHETLRARIMREYPSLSTDPGFSLRLLQSEFVDLYRGELLDPIREARALIESQLRYRLADAVNDGLKKVGVQKLVKGLIRPDSDRPYP